MSGPKVVVVVTREELLAIAERHLKRLSATIARWLEEDTGRDNISAETRRATEQRIKRFESMIENEQFTQASARILEEISFIESGIELNRQKAVADKTRQRLTENFRHHAKSLLANKGKVLSETVRVQLEQIVNGNITAGQADDIINQVLLTVTENAGEQTELTAKQRELLQQLAQGNKEGVQRWNGFLHSVDEKIIRLEKHIAELELYSPAIAQPFIQRVEDVRAQTGTSYRLQLDSLMLDVAESVNKQRTVRELTLQLNVLTADLSAHPSLLADIEQAVASTDIERLKRVLQIAQAKVNELIEQHNADSRRRAVLQGLADLGYSVHEEMSTLWQNNGRLVLQNSMTPDYGVELGGNAQHGRLQVRAVSLSENHDARRDRDIETLWCNSFTQLQHNLKRQGSDLIIEKALASGATPLKRIANTDAALMRTGQKPKAQAMNK